MKRIIILIVLSLVNNNFCLAQSLTTIIKTINLTYDSLDESQARRYSALADSSDKYSEVHFIKVVLDTNSFDSLGGFFVSLPTIIDRDLYFNLKSVQLPNESEIHDSTYFYFFGQHFHYPSGEADTLFGYSSLSIFRYDKEAYWGNFKFEDDNYDIYDLGDGLQLLCKNDPGLLPDNECVLSESDTEAEQVITNCEDRKSKVLFIYTTNALKNLGYHNSGNIDVAGVHAHAKMAIFDCNNIWTHSNIAASLVYAGWEHFDIGETGNIAYDGTVTIPNSTTLQSLRNQYEAEIICVFTGHYNSSWGFASQIGASANMSSVIVDATEAWSSRHTFAHEIGHLFNAQHDNVSSGNNRGYVFKTGTGAFNWGGKSAIQS